MSSLIRVVTDEKFPKKKIRTFSSRYPISLITTAQQKNRRIEYEKVI